MNTPSHLFGPGMPRFVGAAAGNHIGGHFSAPLEIRVNPYGGVHPEHNPFSRSNVAKHINYISRRERKGQRLRPRPSPATTPTVKPLKIGDELAGKPGSPRSLEHTSPFDALDYPRHLLNGRPNSPRKLPGVQTPAAPLKARNEELAGLENTFMAEMELPE